MIRIVNDNLGRALHNTLYHALRNFAYQYTPELPSEPVVNAFLTRLYNSDPDLHILVEIDKNYTITEHAVIDIQRAFGYSVVYCHQFNKTTPTQASYQHTDEFMEYLDKLQQENNSSCIVFFVVKNAKVFEKRYGYKTLRTAMIKTPEHDELMNEEE